jgi:DNA-3-methyladenine glycosylase
MNRQFFMSDAAKLALQLLGCILTYETENGIIGGRIVETESYLASDPASHSFKGKTSRNAAMFLEGGHTYIYRSYGIHYCINVVAGPKGQGDAVLIRALEPLFGIEMMQQNRHTTDLHNLCNGPGKLTQAMGLTLEQNGWDLLTSPLKIIQDDFHPPKIISAPRIGISRSKDHLERFYFENNKFVSHK